MSEKYKSRNLEKSFAQLNNETHNQKKKKPIENTKKKELSHQKFLAKSTSKLNRLNMKIEVTRNPSSVILVNEKIISACE
jgi:hypothetical protein